MALALLDLPNEILVQIVVSLTPSDINNLFRVAQFRCRLQKFILLIKDQDKSQTYPNIPSICHEDFNSYERTGLLQLIELNEFETNNSKKLLEIKDKCPKIITILDQFKVLSLESDRQRNLPSVDITANLISLPTFHPTCDLITKTLQKSALPNSGIKSIWFLNLSTIALRGVELDPSKIHLPNLSFAHFENCSTLNESERFQFPKLEDLQVSGKVKNLFPSFDFTQYPKTLQIVEDSNTWDLSSITFAKLKVLHIDGAFDSLCTIIDCEFPDLKNATSSFVSTNVKTSSFPKLTKLSLHIPTGSFSITASSTPKLRYLDFQCSTTPTIESHDFPNLELVSAGIDHPFHGTGFQIFDAADSLELRSNNLQLLGQIHTTGLKSLGLCLSEADADISNVSFPVLENVQLRLDHTYTRVPSLNAPNLKQLVISECPEVESLSSIPIDYPSLEKLRVDTFENDLILSYLTFPNLLELEIGAGCELINIHACNFPKLKYCSINGMSETSATIKFEAPNLLELSIRDVVIDLLKVDRYPKLQSLAVCKVDKLFLDNMDALIFLDLSLNVMSSFEVPNGLPNLRKLEYIQSNAHLFNVLGLEMTEKERIECFGSRYNEALEDQVGSIDLYGGFYSHLESLEKCIEDDISDN